MSPVYALQFITTLPDHGAGTWTQYLPRTTLSPAFWIMDYLHMLELLVGPFEPGP